MDLTTTDVIHIIVLILLGLEILVDWSPISCFWNNHCTIKLIYWQWVILGDVVMTCWQWFPVPSQQRQCLVSWQWFQQTRWITWMPFSWRWIEMMSRWHHSSIRAEVWQPMQVLCLPVFRSLRACWHYWCSCFVVSHAPASIGCHCSLEFRVPPSLRHALETLSSTYAKYSTESVLRVLNVPSSWGLSLSIWHLTAEQHSRTTLCKRTKMKGMVIALLYRIWLG